MLTGKHVKLVAFHDRYIDFLYEINTDMDEKYLWSDQRDLPERDEYVGRLKEDLAHRYFKFFVITSLQGNPLGFVYAYQYHPWDRNLYMTIYVKPSARVGYASVEGALLMIDYLFTYYDLNKIYSIVYDYNQESLNYQLNGAFEEEGLMKEHRYYDGCYHDAHLLAIYPKKFYERFEKILKNMYQKD